jgi:hypothetical protein
MARTTGPLMSLDASGSIAKTLTFAKWKGRPYVRQLVTPANPRSVAQYYNRAMMAFLSQQWATIAGGFQATFDDIAKQMTVSPFNAYTSYNRKRWTQSLSPTNRLPPGATGPADALSAHSEVAGVRQITGTVTDATNIDNWGCAIAVDAANGATPPINLTRLVIPIKVGTAVAFTIPNLDPGTYSVQYFLFGYTGSIHAGQFATQGLIVT